MCFIKITSSILNSRFCCFLIIEIIRSRDPSIIQACDLVVDVGSEYEPSRHRYDHHQRSFMDTFSTERENLPSSSIKTATRLSSAGLIYKHFGREIIVQLYPYLSQNDVVSLFNRLYEVLIEEFDAVDNGINATTELPKFVIGTSSIFSQVSRLNYIKGESLKNETEETFQFTKAMDLCRDLFLDVLQDLAFNWLPSKSIVAKSITACEGPVVILTEPCFWKDHIFTLEKEYFQNASPLLYVIYENENTGMWMAQTIPKAPGSFESRLAFPQAWRGLRDQELDSVTGISGGVFVHASGFLVGAKSLAIAKALVAVSINIQK